ncbi:MAG: YbaK/EbsC family protein [Alphaproteobacteria bacterium]|nr:YbaK/EbsC family protein [Alphaproteobacteria bacterium]
MSAVVPLSPSAQKVQDALAVLGFACAVIEHEASTRTSAEAAAAVGCTVAQIAKSLIFRTRPGDRPVLVIASGENRVDEKKLAALVGERIERPDAEFVRNRTGFAIGGVPPVGHPSRLATYIDRDLLALGELWAAGGTPNAVFRVGAQDLVAMTQGQVADIARR